MSGNDDSSKKDDSKTVDSDQQEREHESSPVRRIRPRTARPSGRPAPTVSQVQGATGGRREDIREPTAEDGGEGSYTRNLTIEERNVGNQAQFLLEIFISERAQRELPREENEIVQEAVSQCENRKSPGSSRCSQSEESLKDVSMALRDIGDQLSEDYDLNRLIDMVMDQSPREIFMKVCKQIFANNQFNWGRVVAVFYFAYRLITKAVSVTMDKCIPRIKEIIGWSMEFIYQHVIWWIVERGGWGMIREYFGGTPNRYMMTLGIATILTVLYVWWKQQ